MAYKILVPWPGLKSAPPAVEAQNVNYWTAGKVPILGIMVSWWSKGYAHWRMNGFSVTGVSLHNTVLSLLVFTTSLGGREARNSVPTWQMRTLNLDRPARGPTPDTEPRGPGAWLWRPLAGCLCLWLLQRVRSVCFSSVPVCLGKGQLQSGWNPGALEASTLVTFHESLWVTFGIFQARRSWRLKKKKPNVLQVLKPTASTNSAGPGFSSEEYGCRGRAPGRDERGNEPSCANNSPKFHKNINPVHLGSKQFSNNARHAAFWLAASIFYPWHWTFSFIPQAPDPSSDTPKEPRQWLWIDQLNMGMDLVSWSPHNSVLQIRKLRFKRVKCFDQGDTVNKGKDWRVEAFPLGGVNAAKAFRSNRPGFIVPICQLPAVWFV